MATVSVPPSRYEARPDGAKAPAAPAELTGEQSRARTLDWGNSAPLALFAFAVTTRMLSMVNSDAIATGVEPAGASVQSNVLRCRRNRRRRQTAAPA